jgi:hypothetical protein
VSSVDCQQITVDFFSSLGIWTSFAASWLTIGGIELESFGFMGALLRLSETSSFPAQL